MALIVPAPKHCEGWGVVRHDCRENIHCCCGEDDCDLRHAHLDGCYYQEQQAEQSPAAHQRERAVGEAEDRAVPLP